MTLWSHRALLEHDFGVPHLLVHPIIPWGGTVMLHGPYESGKSLLALTLATAVARGETFLGEFHCRQGTVGLIQTDMPDKLYQERQRLAQAATSDLPIFHVTTDASPINILKLGRWKTDLEGLAKERPALLIVDTLRKVHQLDENDSNSASRVYGAFRELFPHATLLFLHHDRKAPTMPVSARALEESFRGNTAWIADLDTGIHLVRQKSGSASDWRAKVTWSKLRTCEEQPPMIVQMHEDTLMLEIAEPTPRQRLHLFLEQNPRASRSEAAGFLQGLGNDGRQACSRAHAYRLVKETWESMKKA